MSSRSPARWLAPLALLVALAAVGLVLQSSTGSSSDAPEAASQTETGETTGQTSTGERRDAEEGTRTTSGDSETPRSYRVQPGDSLGTIAEETGVSIERLQELNPDVDPQSLTVGERLRLAE